MSAPGTPFDEQLAELERVLTSAVDSMQALLAEAGQNDCALEPHEQRFIDEVRAALEQYETAKAKPIGQR